MHTCMHIQTCIYPHINTYIPLDIRITNDVHGILIDGLQPVALVNFPGIVRGHARVSGSDDVVSRRHLMGTFQNLQMQANAHNPAFEVLGAVALFAAEELYAAANLVRFRGKRDVDRESKQLNAKKRIQRRQIAVTYLGKSHKKTTKGQGAGIRVLLDG